jgi:hypothetical protein
MTFFVVICIKKSITLFAFQARQKRAARIVMQAWLRVIEVSNKCFSASWKREKGSGKFTIYTHI